MKWLLRIFVIIFAVGLGLIWFAQQPLEHQFSGIVTYREAPRPAPVSQLRIVTYNIGYASGKKNNLAEILSREEVEANLNRIAQTLKTLSPDIVGLQEIDFNARRSFHVNQLDYLAKALDMPYAAYVVTWNKRYVAWPYWPISVHFGAIASGQAVLSRYPILDQQTTVFDKPRENPFWYNWFYLDRVMQELKIDIGLSEPAVVWHVHLEAFSSRAREDQAILLADRVAAERAAVKWAIGDFNLENTDDFFQGSGLHNAQSPGLLTMPSWKPIQKIDHILYSGSAQVHAVGTVPGETASDHLPVWADFTVSE